MSRIVIDTLELRPDLCPIDRTIGLKNTDSPKYKCHYGHEWVFVNGSKIYNLNEYKTFEHLMFLYSEEFGYSEDVGFPQYG